ncbi:MAG: hypothetical protein ACFBSE_24380 [Prochloraceae cyanobacterium]
MVFLHLIGGGGVKSLKNRTDNIGVNKNFYGKLPTIIDLLKDLKDLERGTETLYLRQDKINYFMDLTMELYLSVQLDPSLKSESQFQEYINESANLLCGVIGDLLLYISSIEKIVTLIMEVGEWRKVCWRRSAIESLKELYQNTVFEQYFSEIDTEDDLDLILESKGKKEGPVSEEEIPDGIPSSHWWWWGEEPEESDYEIAG